MKYFSFLLDTIRWDNHVLEKQFAEQFQWCLFYNLCLKSKQIHAFAVSCNHRGCKLKAGPAVQRALFRNIHTKHNDWFISTVEIITELSSSCQKQLKNKTNKKQNVKLVMHGTAWHRYIVSCKISCIIGLHKTHNQK